MAKRDYYEALGVARNADDDTLKKAYRRMAMKYHPDRNQGAGAKEAETRFKEAKEAFEVLSDPQNRAAYDQFGHNGLVQRNGGFKPKSGYIFGGGGSPAEGRDGEGVNSSGRNHEPPPHHNPSPVNSLNKTEEFLSKHAVPALGFAAASIGAGSMIYYQAEKQHKAAEQTNDPSLKRDVLLRKMLGITLNVTGTLLALAVLGAKEKAVWTQRVQRSAASTAHAR